MNTNVNERSDEYLVIGALRMTKRFERKRFLFRGGDGEAGDGRDQGVGAMFPSEYSIGFQKKRRSRRFRSAPVIKFISF